MIIFNETINIDDSVHQQWLTWMRETHIPNVLATNAFSGAKMVKVLVEEEMGGQTYSLQYATDSLETLRAFQREHAPRLEREALIKFADKMLVFRTELQLVEEFTKA
ncbi:MAG: DUF4286 family protein [Flavobacterium sp.]|nr:DUF4286 family protein [Candidatus Neoflavobacterium equi]